MSTLCKIYVKLCPGTLCITMTLQSFRVREMCHGKNFDSFEGKKKKKKRKRKKKMEISS